MANANKAVIKTYVYLTAKQLSHFKLYHSLVKGGSLFQLPAFCHKKQGFFYDTLLTYSKKSCNQLLYNGKYYPSPMIQDYYKVWFLTFKKIKIG